MAKFGETKQTYTTSLQHFLEGAQELNYPVEVFKDGYYRVVGAHREHWQALRDGWVEEKESGITYKPLSAHPDSIAKAKQQQERLAAEEEALRRQKESNGMVSMAEVQAMIAAALASKPAAFSPEMPKEETV